MSLRMIKLRLRILVEADDNGFHAYCPELQGIHVHGGTEAEAVEHAKVAANLYIQSLIKHDDPIPLGVVEQDVSFGDLVGEFVRKLKRPGSKIVPRRSVRQLRNAA
ncbi:MAG: type II toxin-antitoxin system HicB family antitoxin [Gammaproteobacteria bacterium]|nr:type II toxin-antitoxin system HicB family antitoxin [Gammaproteobacteria bacterium]